MFSIDPGILSYKTETKMNDLTVGYPHTLNTFVYYGKGYKSPLSFTTKREKYRIHFHLPRKKEIKRVLKFSNLIFTDNYVHWVINIHHPGSEEDPG